MQVEVKIDQDAVQQQVVQAIMDSAIGENIQKFINDALTRGSGGWGDHRNVVQRAIDDAVAMEIQRIARELMAERRDQIKAQMIEKLTDAVLGKMCDAAWAVMEGKLKASSD